MNSRTQSRRLLEDRKMGLRRRWRFVVVASMALVVLAVGLIVLAVGACCLQGEEAMRHAYMADRATLCATKFVEKYVREQGKGPTSWKDLESMSATSRTDFLPSGGWEEVRTYVEIA